jgi:hypothetical protein
MTLRHFKREERIEGLWLANGKQKRPTGKKFPLGKEIDVFLRKISLS